MRLKAVLSVDSGVAQPIGARLCQSCTFLLRPAHMRKGITTTVLQMTQRPPWRHRAAEAGVIFPLVELVRPASLSIDPFPDQGLSAFQKSLLGHNMLVQVFFAINWYALARVFSCAVLYHGIVTQCLQLRIVLLVVVCGLHSACCDYLSQTSRARGEEPPHPPATC